MGRHLQRLKQGDRDLLVSSITITDERRQAMDFSVPYFDAHQLIAVRADSTVARFDDLKTLKVGVQTGTTGDETISAAGQDEPDIKRFEARRWRSRSSRPAASTPSSPTTAWSSTTSRTTAATSSGPSTIRRSRRALRHRGEKGNAELLDKLNQGLAAIRADGSYDRIYAQDLGAPAPAGGASAPAAAASKSGRSPWVSPTCAGASSPATGRCSCRACR